MALRWNRERWRARFRRLRWPLFALPALCIAIKLIAVLAPHPPLRTRFSSSVAVWDAHHRLLRLTLSEDEAYRLWIPLSEMAPSVVQGTLLYEDRHFYRHFAVNPWSLIRAAGSTWLGGGRRIGGSTITMQLARRIHGVPSRSITGKLHQIARAIQLELQYSKDEILEAYLNTAPYGGNVEGVGAASLIYFGKPADRLLLPEALSLAVIPQSPTRRAPSHDDKEQAGNPLLISARNALFQSWLAAHPEARGDEQLFKMPLPMRAPGSLPFLAPHLVDSILATNATKPNPETRIVTTLSLPLQRRIERHLKAYVARGERVGIHNAAAMLVDSRTMEVKALVGSADFASDEIAGQVNGAAAKRSPGSALKPFVYALGIEQGVIHPETMLKDAPVAFGPYSPENFDGRFVGPITAREALIRSRNIPALAVAAKLAKPDLYELLKMAGVARMREESHYGLSLALGGGEVTMEELLTLYGALANRGMLRPLRYRMNDPVNRGVRLISEEAAFVVLDMLKDNPRPDRMGQTNNDRGLPVYWKTGTSYGFRDAWSVGIFGPYLLAVWVGNFSGEGNPAFVGVQAAAPLFFEIVDSVVAEDRGIAEPPRPVPPGLERIQVCAVSGQLPGKHCGHTKATWFIPGRSPIDTCAIHRLLVIDDHTGKQVCLPESRTKQATHEDVYEMWPSDLAELFRLAGVPRRTPPEAGADCGVAPQAFRGAAPHITSPVAGVTYSIRGSVKGVSQGAMNEDRIALTATTDGDAREVYWFVDDAFVGKAQSGKPLFVAPRTGTFTVRAVDDLGRSDSRQLQAEAAPGR